MNSYVSPEIYETPALACSCTRMLLPSFAAALLSFFVRPHSMQVVFAYYNGVNS
jgi:hypothetical protein